MAKPRRQTLPDLPNAIIIRIAENLPLKDLPSLASSCKTLASMAGDLYKERQVLDMSCFEPATPNLCDQLITRFSVARLHKLYFRYDLRYHRDYDAETVEAIVARFLDNVNPSGALFQRDLRSGTPRMVEILAHCYFLDRFLSSQPHLRALDVDVEVSVFTLPSARGPRLDWHLLNPFITLDAVRRRCAELEYCSTHTSSYQMTHMDLLHVHMRFLHSCPKLKSASLVFVLGTEELDMYARLRRQLALEQAVFYLPGWRVGPDQRRLAAARLSDVAARLDRLRKAAVSFRRRGCLSDCRTLFTGLPRIESLYLRCEFNPRYPVYDIDEGTEMFFGDAFSLLKAAPCPPRRLLLWGVPEDEFETLFEGVLPQQVTEIRVQLHWYSAYLDERRERLLDDFLKNAGHLETFCVAGVPPVPPSQEMQPPPVFFKAKNWQPGSHSLSCMFIFSGGKRKNSSSSSALV